MVTWAPPHRPETFPVLIRKYQVYIDTMQKSGLLKDVKACGEKGAVWAEGSGAAGQEKNKTQMGACAERVKRELMRTGRGHLEHQWPLVCGAGRSDLCCESRTTPRLNIPWYSHTVPASPSSVFCLRKDRHWSFQAYELCHPGIQGIGCSPGLTGAVMKSLSWDCFSHVNALCRARGHPCLQAVVFCILARMFGHVQMWFISWDEWIQCRLWISGVGITMLLSRVIMKKIFKPKPRNQTKTFRQTDKKIPINQTKKPHTKPNQTKKINKTQWVHWEGRKVHRTLEARTEWQTHT